MGCGTFWSDAKGWFQKGVLAHVPLPLNRGKGTSAACNLTLEKGKSKKGVKVHLPKMPFDKTALLFGKA